MKVTSGNRQMPAGTLAYKPPSIGIMDHEEYFPGSQAAPWHMDSGALPADTDNARLGMDEPAPSLADADETIRQAYADAARRHRAAGTSGLQAGEETAGRHTAAGAAKPTANKDGNNLQAAAGIAKSGAGKGSSSSGTFSWPVSGSDSKGSGSGFKMKSSAPDDSVGQLASMLAHAETRLDVQQVYSRAMRALAALKMSAMAAESGDAKKIAQMVRRMEKLIKRIQKKLKNLSKEEQLEKQREKAQKAMDQQKEKQIREELRSRRRKRRREERQYAMKEVAEDNKNTANELTSSMMEAISSSSVPDITALTGTGAYGAASGFSADISAVEGISVDVMV